MSEKEVSEETGDAWLSASRLPALKIALAVVAGLGLWCSMYGLQDWLEANVMYENSAFSMFEQGFLISTTAIGFLAVVIAVERTSKKAE